MLRGTVVATQLAVCVAAAASEPVFLSWTAPELAGMAMVGLALFISHVSYKGEEGEKKTEKNPGAHTWKEGDKPKEGEAETDKKKDE